MTKTECRTKIEDFTQRAVTNDNIAGMLLLITDHGKGRVFAEGNKAAIYQSLLSAMEQNDDIAKVVMKASHAFVLGKEYVLTNAR